VRSRFPGAAALALAACLAGLTACGSSSPRTLPVWRSSFSNVFGTDWGATMAASTLFMLRSCWSSCCRRTGSRPE